MVDKITTGGTQIFKFNAKDKKDIGIKKFKFAVQQGKKIRGFKTLSEVNKALGRTGRTKLTSRSFRRR